MEKKELGWLSLSRNTKGPRFIVDEAGNPVNLFGMARCQIHTLDETRDIGEIHTLCRHYRELGCNALRLSFSKFRIEAPQEDFIEDCGGYNPEGIRAFIEKYVEPDVRAIIEEGLYVVLDLHEYPPNDDHDDPNPACLIQYAREKYIPLWRELARYYKDEPGIAMYELWNEPYAADQGTLSMGDDGYIRGGTYNNFDWNHHVRRFFIDCAAVIREEDTRHMLLVSDYNAGWGCGWAITWLGHTEEVDPSCRNTLFSIHAAAEHLGPRIDFFDDWWASICREHNIFIQFGEIETEDELMTPEAMRNLVEMFRRRREEYHYAGFLWRPHSDEENYVPLWKDFAREYTRKD